MELVTNFGKLAKNEDNISQIKDIIQTKAKEEKGFTDFFTLQTGVKNGEQIGAVNGLENISKVDTGCKSAFDPLVLPAFGQRWKLTPVEAQFELCYADFKDSFVSWGLQQGVDVGNMDNVTDLAGFLTSLIIKGLSKDLNKAVLMGYEGIEIESNGGVLKNTANKNNYNFIKEGLIPTLGKLKTLGDAEIDNKIIDLIGKNASTTPYNLASGEAQTILEELIDTDFEGNTILTNYALYKNYSKGLRALPIDSSKADIVNGARYTFDGYNYVTSKEYDRLFKNEFVQSNGTIRRNHHFGIFYDKSNLRVGIGAKNFIDNLDMWYDKNDKTFKIRANYMADFKIMNPYEIKAIL